MKVFVAILGLAAAATIGTLSAVASSAEGPSFELVVSGHHEVVPQSLAFPFGIRHVGTFTATPPFCSSGTFHDLTNDLLNSMTDYRLYTCDDGSGTLTTVQEDWFEHKPPWGDVWQIDSGTGRYEGLHGRGVFRGELLSGDNDDPLTVFYRSTFTGHVDYDRAGPTVTIRQTRVTKLHRVSRGYVIAFSVTFKDKQLDPIGYIVAVESPDGLPYLADRKGTTTTGKLNATLRIHARPGLRQVTLQVRGEDALGNVRWASKRLALPR